MTWLARLELVWVGLVATGCALDSKPIGEVAESSSSADDGTMPESGDDDTSATGGDELCPGNPRFACTVPYECGGFPCTADPFDDLDENGCPSVTCTDSDDCEAGSVCAPSHGSSGFSCADMTIDGVTECVCGADPGGFPPNLCVPLAAVDMEAICAGLPPGSECDDVPEIPYDEEHAWTCRTVDILHLVYDESTDSCAAEPQQICLAGTYNVFGGEDGCGGSQCTFDTTELFGGAVRELAPGEYQLLSVRDYYCGDEGAPLGEWTECNDPALGPCACTCG